MRGDLITMVVGDENLFRLLSLNIYYTKKRNLQLINVGIYSLKAALKLAHLSIHRVVYELELILKQ
jgi:hypothetical protein